MQEKVDKHHDITPIIFLTGNIMSGGAELQTYYLLQKFGKKYQNLHLVLFEPKGLQERKLPAHITYHVLNRIPKISFLARILVLFFLIKRIKPQIIYTNLWCSAYLMMCMFQFFGRYFAQRPRVVYYISNNVDYYQNRRRFFCRFLRDPEVTLITHTKRNAERIEEIMDRKKKVHIIPCGIDTDLIKLQAKGIADKNNDNIFSIIHIGSFSKQKRHDRLLQVAVELKKRKLNFELNMLGDGFLMEVVRRMVTELNLDDSVHFLGYKKNPYLYLANSDLLVLTSDYEGYGIVLIEALSLGIPVVSTDVEFGPREIINDRVNGRLTTTEPENIADAIIDVLKNKHNYSTNARCNANISSVDKLFERHENVFINAVKE